MPGFLIDTNVLSELTRQHPSESVVEFLGSQDRAFLSVVTVEEIRYGVQRLPDGERRRKLIATIDKLLSEYAGSIIPIGVEEADHAGALRARREATGRKLHLADALIAASAAVNGLTLATRNVADFAGLDVAVVNPWEA